MVERRNYKLPCQKVWDVLTLEAKQEEIDVQQLTEIVDSRKKELTDEDVLKTQLPLDDLDALNIQIEADPCPKTYCERDYDSTDR